VAVGGDAVRIAGQVVGEDVGRSLVGTAQPEPPEAAAVGLGDEEEALVPRQRDAVGEVEAAQEDARRLRRRIVGQQSAVRPCLQQIVEVLAHAETAAGVREVDGAV